MTYSILRSSAQAGAAQDILARLLQPHLEKALGQPVIVENRSGASTMIGTEAVAKATPDGHTLLIVPTTFTVNAALNTKLTFDLERDFEPITVLVKNPLLFAVNAKVPATDTGIASGYAFRTPSLRNLRYTAPYMHNGTLATLQDVLGFYNNGRRRGRNPNVRRDQLDPLLNQLNVRRGGSDIIEFLNALNDDGFDREIPARVPSGLTPGGLIR